MKRSMILVAATILAVGCDQQRQASNDTTTSSDKSTIRQSARDAKSAVDKEARAQKEMLDKEAKAAQAQIDAEKARAKAAGTDAEQKVDAASQNIREAAGSASTKVQSEVGAAKSDTVAPPTAPANPSTTSPAIPVPTTPTTATADADQRLVDQVKAALTGGAGAEATADNTKNIQVSASGGTVTLKGAVKDEEEKSRLEAAAKAVPGVTRVDNQLQVKQ
jgi:osmotically-inducible protein OsmY